MCESYNSFLNEKALATLYNCQHFGYIGRLAFSRKGTLLSVGNLLNLFNWWNFLEQMFCKDDQVLYIVPPLNKSINVVTGSGHTQVFPKLLSVLCVSLRYQVVGTHPLSDADYPATRCIPLL